MSLLLDLMANAVDQGYEAAARRRDAAPAGERRTVATGRRPRSTSWLAAWVAIVGAGLLFATAAVQAHRGAATAARQHRQLVQQIQQQTSAVDALQRQDDGLRSAITMQRDKGIADSSQGASLRNTIDELSLADGSQAVTGPGTRVVLDDASTGGATTDNTLGTIYDRDIQAVTNALWQAGAEAIAVNGARLTSQSSIREAGEAILVGYQPLSPPYTIDAIGGPGMTTAFRDSQTGQLYETWRQVYGLGFDVSAQARLTLPSAATSAVQYAHPLGSP